MAKKKKEEVNFEEELKRVLAELVKTYNTLKQENDEIQSKMLKTEGAILVIQELQKLKEVS